MGGGVRVFECPVLNGIMKIGFLPFTHLSTHPPIHAVMDPFTHLPTYPSTYPSIPLSHNKAGTICQVCARLWNIDRHKTIKSPSHRV